MTTYLTHRRAKFDYDILEKIEAGVVLFGCEVKSLRNGRGKLEGGYVIIRGKEAFLVGVSIPPFQVANAPKDYDPERPRKLLLSQREIAKIEEKSDRQGLTVVPLRWYNKKRKVKLEIALAKGKKKADKRESIKKRDNKRTVDRLLKSR